MGRNPVGSRHVHRDDCTLLANPQVRGRHRKLPCEVAGVQATSHRQGGRKASTPRTLGGCRSTHVPRRRPLPRSPRFPPGRAPSGRRPRGWRVAVRGTGAYGRPSCARCMRVTSHVSARARPESMLRLSRTVEASGSTLPRQPTGLSGRLRTPLCHWCHDGRCGTLRDVRPAS